MRIGLMRRMRRVVWRRVLFKMGQKVLLSIVNAANDERSIECILVL